MDKQKQMQELINDLYPAIAGLVIAAQMRGETNAEKMWNDYCKRMIKLVT